MNSRVSRSALPSAVGFKTLSQLESVNSGSTEINSGISIAVITRFSTKPYCPGIEERIKQSRLVSTVIASG